MVKKRGLSLSFCVRDIIIGKIKESDVEKIVTGTSVKTETEWRFLIKQYQKIYWIDNPAEGEAICRRLLKAGKIEQPLLKGEKAPDLSSGQHWINLGIAEST